MATKAGTQAKRHGVYLRDIQAVDKSLQACTSPAATTCSSHSNGDDWSAWLLAIVEKLLLFLFYLLVGGTQLWDGCEWCWRSWRLLCRTCTNFRSFFVLVKQSPNARCLKPNQTSNTKAVAMASAASSSSLSRRGSSGLRRSGSSNTSNGIDDDELLQNMELFSMAPILIDGQDQYVFVFVPEGTIESDVKEVWYSSCCSTSRATTTTAYCYCCALTGTSSTFVCAMSPHPGQSVHYRWSSRVLRGPGCKQEA